MFAVPGWSISGDNLKIETHKKASSNKKRKRSSQDDVPIDASEIGDLWKNHVEAKEDDGQQESINGHQTISKKEKKRLKRGLTTQIDATKDIKVGMEHKNELLQRQQEADRGTKKSQGAAREVFKDRTAKILDGEDKPKSRQEKEKEHKSIEHDQASNKPSKASNDNAIAPVSTKHAVKLTPLQASMRQKLISSRFRHLNETLYTTPSTSSLELFKTNPEFFSEYHEGFRRQVEAWPENPLDNFLRWIEERGPIGIRNNKEPRRKASRNPAANTQGVVEPEVLPEAESLPRDPRKGICTISDLGCGDGKLGLELTHSGLLKKVKLKVHSFDLMSAAPHVQVADIKSLPLEDSSVDIAIFCLALMGTNWIDFIEEAYRVLHWKGECWIAEVTSRFAAPKSTRVEHSVGNKVKTKQKKKTKHGNNSDVNEDGIGDLGLVDDIHSAPQNTVDVSAFVAVLRRRGFMLQGTPQTDNKMFVQMRFIKALPPRRGKSVKTEKAGGKKKFIEDADKDDITVEDEAKVLKPCVYKIR